MLLSFTDENDFNNERQNSYKSNSSENTSNSSKSKFNDSINTENNTRIWLQPTYDVMRNIALTDNISFPWFASAGYTRGIVNAVKARKKLT